MPVQFDADGTLYISAFTIPVSELVIICPKEGIPRTTIECS